MNELTQKQQAGLANCINVQANLATSESRERVLHLSNVQAGSGDYELRPAKIHSKESWQAFDVMLSGVRVAWFSYDK